MKKGSTSFAPDSIALTTPRKHWPTAIFLLAVTLLAYGNLIRADFSALDDPFNISLNPNFNPPSAQGIAHYWNTRGVYGLYIPLTYTVWGILASVAYVPTPDEWGVHLNPSIFHLANVVIHACSVLAVFALLLKLLRSGLAACAGALLFSLHPLQVEAVGWAAGLKDVLSGMFSLVALWQYVVHANGESKQPSRAYLIATAALILAMLSKPSAMMTPLLALVIDAWWIKRGWRTVLKSAAPWLLLGLICGINARLVQGSANVDAGPLWARPLIAGDTLAFYLSKLFLPLNLAVDYGRKPAVVLGASSSYFAWMIPALVATGLILLRKRYPLLLLGGVSFIVGIAPVLGLTPFLYQQFSTTADHYLYLAMLGPAIVAGALMTRTRGHGAVAVGACVLLILAILTIRQTQVWQNDIALFSHAHRITPGSTLVMNNLGHAYLIKGRYAEAQELLEKVVALEPENVQARTNLEIAIKGRALDRASSPATTTAPAP